MKRNFKRLFSFLFKKARKPSVDALRAFFKVFSFLQPVLDGVEQAALFDNVLNEGRERLGLIGLAGGDVGDDAGGDIHLQDDELSSGNFYTRDHLPELPRKLSLARKMIDWWIAQQ